MRLTFRALIARRKTLGKLAASALFVAGVVPGAGAAAERWLVGTTAAPPFVIENSDGSFSGLSVGLWEVIADELDIDYELRGYPRDALWDAVAEGEVDLAIGGLDVTAELERRVDFTHPYYSAGLGVATRWRADPGWREDIVHLLNDRVLRIVAVGFVLLLLVGGAIWRLERRRNPRHFAPEARGVGDGIWWSGVTMATVGYGDKAPVTPAGRAFALGWMFASLVLVACMTGAIASALTVSHLRHAIDSVADLSSVRIAAVSGSFATSWLDDRGIGYEEAGDPGAAFDLLLRGRAEAVIHDAPVLRYLIRTELANRAELSPLEFSREDYAFALPPGSPHREVISAALIDQVHDGAWREIRRLYLGH